MSEWFGVSVSECVGWGDCECVCVGWGGCQCVSVWVGVAVSVCCESCVGWGVNSFRVEVPINILLMP